MIDLIKQAIEEQKENEKRTKIFSILFVDKKMGTKSLGNQSFTSLGKVEESLCEMGYIPSFINSPFFKGEKNPYQEAIIQITYLVD